MAACLCVQEWRCSITVTTPAQVLSVPLAALLSFLSERAMKGLRSVRKETVSVGGLEPFSSTSMSISFTQIAMRAQLVGSKKLQTVIRCRGRMIRRKRCELGHRTVAEWCSCLLRILGSTLWLWISPERVNTKIITEKKAHRNPHNKEGLRDPSRPDFERKHRSGKGKIILLGDPRLVG